METALSGIVGDNDISPQVQTIDASNPGTNVNINTLSFSTATVRSATVNYSVFRQTDSIKVHEGGTIIVVYNPDNPVGNKWELSREFTGDASITFNITDTGQFQFSTTAITGSGHQGWITFFAKALNQV